MSLTQPNDYNMIVQTMSIHQVRYRGTQTCKRNAGSPEKMHIIVTTVFFPQAATGHKVSFPFFMAFNSLLTNMELCKRIYLNSSGGSRTQEVTRGEVLLGYQQLQRQYRMLSLYIYILMSLMSPKLR